MNINIIAGKCSEDNNLKIFEILKNRDKSKKNYVIAPDRSLFSIERRLFDELDEECFFDISVMSFTKLSKKLIQNTNKNILTKQSGIALVKKLLIENKDKLLTFGKATNYLGFATSLFETICLFKSCNIGYQDIYVTDSSDYSNLKNKDIKLIYEKYEDFLKNDYTDSFNQLKLFADMIDKSFCEDINFYIVEFDDFTALMYLIIARLAKFSNSIYICTTFGKDNNNSNIYTNKVYYDLIDLFKFEGLNYNINKLENNDILVNNLLAYIPSKSDSKSNINVLSFENKNDEIRYVVADIYSKVCMKDRLNFGDFAIVLPSLSNYKNDLKSEFEKYKIPYYFDCNENLSEYVLIRLAFDICELLKGNFLASDILNVIKNSFLNFNNLDVCDYDNYLRASGKRGFGCLKYDMSSEELKEFFDKLLQWKDDIKSQRKIAEYYDIVDDIYRYLMFRGETFVSKFTPLENRMYEQVKNKIESIRKDYLSVFGDNEVEFDEFLETYRAYFESSDISLPPITSNTIFVADFEKSYISKIDYVYVLGCNEGKLPNFKIDNGLISDEEIAKLPNAKKINPTINLINQRKTFKMFDLMQRARINTFVSFYKSSGEGKTFPNTLIKSILSIYDIDIVDGSSTLDYLNNSLIDINIDNLVFNNFTEESRIDNALELVKNWKVYSKYPNYRQMLSLLTKSIDNQNIYRLIDNNKSKSCNLTIKDCNMFKNNTTSISQIETYYNCPYKHFARYGLHIEIAKNYELKPNDIGTIIHTVLKEIMPSILKNDDIEKILATSQDILDKVLCSENYKEMASNEANSYVIKALKKELDRIIVGIVEQVKVSSYKPNLRYLEYGFASECLNSRGIKIKGIIDRVDVWNDNYIIIDYKTGDSSFDNYTDVASGKKLQLLVYAKAFGEKSKLKPNGVFYLPISNAYSKSKQTYKFAGVINNDINNIYAIDNGLMEPSYKSSVVNLSTKADGEISKSTAFSERMCLNYEDFEYLIDYAIDKVNIAIDNILDGDITPRPLKTNNSSVCDYCEYKGLCNYQKDNDRYVRNCMTIEELKNIGEKNIGV